MGVEFKIVIDDENRSKCKKAARAAFAEAHRLNSIFSDYLADSEISKLSGSSYSNCYFEVSKELFEVLRFGNNLSSDSHGAFDITIGPLSRLWRVARFRKTMPSKNQIVSSMKRVGYDKISFHPTAQKIKLNTSGMLLDAGSIAKGYAGDKMLEILKIHGLQRVLIDTGGDLVIGRAPRKKQGWKVQIGGAGDESLPTLNLSNCSVATSGDTEQFLEWDGMIYSHVINPLTGLGITSRSQVTVIAKSGLVADSIASASLVLGKESSIHLYKKHEVYSVYFMTLENDNYEIHLYESQL